MNDFVALLKLYQEWGIDTPIAIEPTDKATFASTVARSPKRERLTRQPSQKAPVRAQPAPHMLPTQLEELASKQVQDVRTLGQLQVILDSFTACPLQNTAMHSLVPYGPKNAPLMIIGDAPDGQEDRAGRAFVGQTGQLLESILQYLPLKPEELVVASAIPWRPPGGRPPNINEQLICRPFLEKAITLLAPRHILLCGKLATQMVVKKKVPLPQKKWLRCMFPGESSIPVLAMRHPLQLRTSAKARQEIWETMLNVTQTVNRCD